MSGTASPTVTFAPFRLEQADELVAMWRASFEHGVGIVDPNPLAGQRDYLLTRVVPNHVVRLAMLDGAIVGFVAASRTRIDQLYVRVDWLRRGIGGALLRWAQDQSDGTLRLYAFLRNRNACAFYERHGFVAIAYGFEPKWGLDDVEYEWRREGASSRAR